MIRGVVALVCTALAVAALALALQVRSWQNGLRDDDLRFQVTPLAKGLWNGPGGMGSGVARRTLGVADDVRLRNAEQLFVQVHARTSDYAGETRRLEAFGRAQSTLQDLARTDPQASRRARAANLLGILLWEDAGAAQDNAPLLLRQSMGAFRDAVRDAPAAGDPKYNLELLMTLVQPRGERRRDAPEQAGGSGLRGAGLGAAGRGY